MIIKVCGMRNADNIRAAEQTGIDWMGFIFHPQSPRFVGNTPPEYMPRTVKRVGVFVNQSTQTIIDTAQAFGLNMVQLHGNETPEQCTELARHGIDVMKALRIASDRPFPTAEADSFHDRCRYLLFDTHTPNYGGSGQKFDWSILNAYVGKTPFIIGGGISPHDAEAIHAFNHPQFAGIDLNSRFEDAPAQKNIETLTSFINQIRTPQ